MLRVTLHSFRNANASQRALGERAIQTLTAVVNDPEFIERVGNADYSRRRWKDENRVPRDVTNAKVVELIESGSEHRQPRDEEVDLTIRLMRLEKPTTLGYVLFPSPLITTNSTWFNKQLPNDALSVAAHWMHEWTHVVGFTHVKADPRPVRRRDVSYTVGRIVVEVGQRIAAAEGRESVEVAEMGRGYLDATDEDSCPVYEDGVPAEFIVPDEDTPDPVP